MARYGMPWQGSKSRIAEWVVGLLPPSHTLVDLFAGGGAVTHCALLSGKWERIIANDMTDSMKVFVDAIRGEFAGYATVPTRDEFMASEDTMLRMLYSFGNDRTTYLWSPELEAVKVPASRMLCASSLHERRMAYIEFCKNLATYLRGDDCENAAYKLVHENAGGSDGLKGLQGIASLERLRELESLERLQALEHVEALERVEALQGDYRLVDIPEGATVYADPPYRGTSNSSRYGAFDFDAFDQWLGGVDFPVFVSEFDAPAGCVEVAQTERTTSMAANSTDKRIERLFVQERFVDSVQVGEPTLF